MTEKRLAFGKAGEKAAVDFIKKKGYRILKKNFRSAVGEIDIIAEHERAVVFIEVKTRSSDKYGHPFDAITPAKQKKIAQTAQSFISRYKAKNRDLRFDVVAVTGEAGETDSLKVELLQDALRL